MSDKHSATTYSIPAPLPEMTLESLQKVADEIKVQGLDLHPVVSDFLPPGIILFQCVDRLVLLNTEKQTMHEIDMRKLKWHFPPF